MEKYKKARTPLRGSFTKAANTLDNLLENATDANKEELQACMDSIERKSEKITELDKLIINSMLDDNEVTDEHFATEEEGITAYEDKLFLCRRKVEKVLLTFAEKEKSVSEYGSAASINSTRKSKKYKLPKIEFAKFGGDIKDWLGFWAQFQKIHQDTEMASEDKFHYLRQCTVENSKAREVVDSFPMTADNYEKVIDHFVNRFGNKDMLVEVYVRELLKLVLSNALNPTKKIVISSLYDKLETQLRALETLNVTRQEFVAILYPLVESCLPEELLRAWERYRIIPLNATGNQVDRLTHLMSFIKGEVESEERIAMARSGFGDQAKKNNKKETSDIPTAAGLLVGSSENKKICVFCSESSHYSDQCPIGKKMSLSDRQKKCDQQKACYACLVKGHWSRDCTAKHKLKCHSCGGRHRQIMCSGKSHKPVDKKTETKETKSENSSVVATVTDGSTKNLLVRESNKCETVLSTLLIRIRNGDKMKIVRAAIDSGSHKTYMLKRLIKELGLEKIGTETLYHELFGGHITNETVHGRYTICAESLEGNYTDTFEVLEQERICHNVMKIQKGPWMEELRRNNILISDAGNDTSEIELLIGGNIAGRLLIGIHRLEGHADFVAMNYSLGWTIMGQIPTFNIRSDKTLLVHTLFVREAKVSDLWKLDLIGIEDYAETRKKEKCLIDANERFKKTMKINEEGRYEIALPFVEGCPSLKTNRSIAEQRLLSLTKKLTPEFKKIYQQIFDDWETDGIIEQVQEDELSNFGHYLPHKAILKPTSLTTPVRPVFDASAKEKNSVSLNDCLEKGPNLLEVISSVVIRFRMRKVGIIADVKKAFLQISIRSEDRDFLRFLWWDKHDDKKIKVYRHRRLVFGLTCSSFLLAATIITTLEEAPIKYEQTASQLKNGIYVDNCVTSVDDEESAIKFKEEAIKLFASAKFDLREWEWNCTEYTEEFTKTISVLGLTWDLVNDTLTCDIDKGDPLDNGPITKRKILSTAHRIFDPVGFTVPLAISPKLLLQGCWELEIGWNDPVPEQIAIKFKKWCEDLGKVKSITIPRWVGFSSSNLKSAILHVFTDASKLAYTVGAFIRIEDHNEIIVKLVQAKARVAPLKKLSINRLELLGCLIGARLSNKLKMDMGLQEMEVIYWTDSSNALHWIKNDDQWGIFVWNRVKEIRSVTDIKSWRYVPGSMNPADLPSRGCSATRLAQSSWWEGPEWLKLPEREWPNVYAPPNEDVLKAERKKIVISAWEHARVRVDTSWIMRLGLSYDKIIHFVALMKRLVKNRGKSKRDKITGNLSAGELDIAEKHILMMIQNEAFTVNDPILNTMELIRDDHGVLRVKTKILLRDDIESFKTPAVLPKKHPIVDEIIQYYHRSNSHASTNTLMALLRDKF